jgi:phosphoserine aminotransferase
VPPRESWRLDADAAYVHICANETIGGVEYHFTPDTGAVPLVADMSSNILSRPVDVARYGLIYGGAQKNIGPAGLTIVIVRDDLIGQAHPLTPSAFDYQQQAANDSMLNTPPTYAIYIAGLVFRWVKERGGLAAMAEHNRVKAALLYDYLDQSALYRNPVALADRSLMNVPFKLKDEALDDAFLKGAQARGLVQLKGHRSVGGMRASLYNAMPVEGVQALVAYMKEFEARHGRAARHPGAQPDLGLGPVAPAVETYTVGKDVADPVAILVRSADLHAMAIPASVRAIGRAGVGTNNIPVEAMSRRGVPCSTPPAPMPTR